MQIKQLKENEFEVTNEDRVYVSRIHPLDCTCASFKFKKKGEYCKHIQAVMDMLKCLENE